MKECLLVGFGGMFGCVARYLAGIFFVHLNPLSKFPSGTLIVNLLGCLLIGIIAGLLERITSYNAEIRLILITGFLGGFTTFSAFAIETLHLLKEGSIVTALAYSCGSLALGVLAAFVGMRLFV